MRSQKHKLGFSLIEVVFAVGIFAILAVGVILVASNSYDNFFRAGDKVVLVPKVTQKGLEAINNFLLKKLNEQINE